MYLFFYIFLLKPTRHSPYLFTSFHILLLDQKSSLTCSLSISFILPKQPPLNKMADDMRMDGQDDRDNNQRRTNAAAQSIPDDEPALEGYAR